MPHTQGPWRWQDWSTYGDPDTGPNRNSLVGPTPPKKPPVPGYTDFNLPPLVLSVEDPIENEADKSLIAAAPELLAALKDARNVLQSCANDTTGTRSQTFFESKVRHCDIVIAKAENRE